MTAGQACVAATRMLVPTRPQGRGARGGQRRVRRDHGRSAHRPDHDDGPGHQRRPARAVRALRRRSPRSTAARSRSAGDARRRSSAGYYFEPTVLDLPDNANPAAQDEIFGPVIGVIGYDDLDDAVRIANDSPYGLSAQVYGADVAGRDRGRPSAAHRRGQREHRRCSAPTRRAAATSRAASAASGAPTASARSKRSSTWRSESCDDGHDDYNLDWLISVDDHILEPPNVWVDRVPAKDRDRAPHMELDERPRLLGLRRQALPELGAERGRGQVEGGVQPRAAPVQRDAARLLRPGGAPRGHGPRRRASRRCASRPSPASAASCSWRRATGSSGSCASRRTTTG